MYFLATSPLIRQYDAMWELEWAFGEDAKIKKTRYPGVILVNAGMSLEDGVRCIREYETTAIFRVVPLESMVKTNIDDIMDEALKISVGKIGKEDSFAVRCRKRGNPGFSSKDLERDLGSRICDETGASVNLDYPNWIVKIEVLGNRSGISVLDPDDIVTKTVLD